MSGYETLLFIHVVGAFAIVAGLACITPLVLEANVDEPAGGRLNEAGLWLFRIGGLLTLVFGLWLIADRDYRFFKGWVLGALILWLVAAGTGEVAASRKDKALYWTAAAATAGVFVLMIFKPGV